MGILKKGKDFSPTEQVTSTKLDELVDNASFTNTSETSVAYTGTTGTCLQGGGLEVTSLGQLQIASSGVDNDNILNDTITSNKLSFIEDSVSTTSGKILVADGSNYDAETMSGDATIAAGGALTIATDAVTPAKTSFLGTVDTTGDSTAHMLIKQSDGEYDSKTLTGDVTVTQTGATSIKDNVALGGNPTATTQSASDNSTKIATTAYVTTGITNALTGSGGIFGSLDQTADSVVRIFSKQADGEYDSVTPSGDVAMAQDGAFTIQANAVEGTMLNSNTVDDSTIELSNDALSIKDDGVTTAKILNSNVTKAKIENVADMKVLGNTSGSAAAPQEVTINDTDTMSDASDTTLATSESIKAYVDTTSESTRVKVATYELASYTLNSDATIPLTEQADPDSIATVSGGVISIGAGTYLIRFYGAFFYQQGNIKVEYKVNSTTVAEKSSTSLHGSGNFVKDYIHVNASGTDTVEMYSNETGEFAITDGKNMGITIMKLGS